MMGATLLSVASGMCTHRHRYSKHMRRCHAYVFVGGPGRLCTLVGMATMLHAWIPASALALVAASASDTVKDAVKSAAEAVREVAGVVGGPLVRAAAGMVDSHLTPGDRFQQYVSQFVECLARSLFVCTCTPPAHATPTIPSLPSRQRS